MTTFTRIPAPNDAMGLMRFPSGVRERIEASIRNAEQSGAWLNGDDILIRLDDPRFWAYWIYKTRHLVRQPRNRGHVTQSFAGNVQCTARLQPDAVDSGDRVCLSLSGDLMAGPGIASSRDALFRHVDELIFGADIAFANLESTRTTQSIPPIELSLERSPVISATQEEYLALTRHGPRRFDVLQLANNHILDFGAEGVACTLAALREDGIAQIGVNETEAEAGRPRVTYTQGLKIGWVAHTFSVNFKAFPPEAPWIVNMTPFHLEADPDTRAIENQTRACRDEGCDLVVVSLHWGLEFELFPHPQQAEWARRFAEAGADLVVGHHPHVAQPMEIYRTSTGTPRQVPILYSLGNLTGVFSHPASVLSLVAQVDIQRSNGATNIAGVELVPVVQLRDPEEGVLQIVPLQSLFAENFHIDEPGALHALCCVADLVMGPDWRVTRATDR